MRNTIILVSATVLALSAAVAFAEETIRPRGQAAYEAELQALTEKYGPQATVSQLRKETQGSTGTIQPTITKPELATEKPVGGVRVTLLPVGENQFLLSEQVFDGTALELHLAQLQTKQNLDRVILLSNNERKIEIPHLLELARLGRKLNIPALYQDGDEIKAIAGR